jgi:hypothetical protein
MPLHKTNVGWLYQPIFAKKFGGQSGNDPDYFLLTVKAFLGGNRKADSVNFYLADYRNSDNSKDYIVNTWKWLNLSSLGLVDSLEFILSSSDNGTFGMNTPAFFALDNFSLDFSNSVNELLPSSSVRVYPNPAKHQLFIDANHANLQSARIYDLSGRQVHQVYGEQISEISLKDIPAGLYMLELKGNQLNVVKKIIIE